MRLQRNGFFQACVKQLKMLKMQLQPRVSTFL